MMQPPGGGEYVRPVVVPSGQAMPLPIGRYWYSGVPVGDTEAVGERVMLGEQDGDTGNLDALRLGVPDGSTELDGVMLAGTDDDGERLAPKDTEGEVDGLTDPGTHESSDTLPAAPPL